MNYFDFAVTNARRQALEALAGMEAAQGTQSGLSPIRSEHCSAAYLGAGLCDKNGVPIREGDSVMMLCEQRRIRRVKWHSLDGPTPRVTGHEQRATNP